MNENPVKHSGILLVDKSAGGTSFQIVSILRRLTGIKTIGHAGTLDPFATGVMVMLIGKEFTRKSNEFLANDKEYEAVIKLGVSTDTYDIEGKITKESDKIPSLDEIQSTLGLFQGKIKQIPPMFSAKKLKGKKLYELARKGIEVEREPVEVTVSAELIRYEYPFLKLKITCSKGTYVRTIAYDLGQKLQSEAHLYNLVRTRSGPFKLKDCIPQSNLTPPFDLLKYIKRI